MNVKKRLKEYKSIYANLPKLQKNVALTVFGVSIMVLAISPNILTDYLPITIIEEYIRPLFISIASTAIFAIVYSVFADYNNVKEVALCVSNEFNHSVPINIYPANDHPENLFKEHLTEELYNCKEYFYEGIDLHTASTCIVKSIHINENCTFPAIHLIVTSVKYLTKKEGFRLFQSIEIIRKFLLDNNLVHNENSIVEQEIKVILHVLPHKTGFHIHLTDTIYGCLLFEG